MKEKKASSAFKKYILGLDEVINLSQAQQATITFKGIEEIVQNFISEQLFEKTSFV